MRRLFKQMSGREGDKSPEPSLLSIETPTLSSATSTVKSPKGATPKSPPSTVTSPKPSPVPKSSPASPGSPDSTLSKKTLSPKGSKPGLKQSLSEHFRVAKDVRTPESDTRLKQTKPGVESPRSRTSKKHLQPVKVVGASPRKPSKKGVATSAAKKSAVNDDFDFGSQLADEEVMSMSSSDDEDERADTVSRVLPSRLTRPLLS